MSALDDAAEALGIELLPWQRDIGQRILDGERVVVPGGRRVGRATLRRVVAEARELAERSRCPKCGGPGSFHDPACVVHPDHTQDQLSDPTLGCIERTDQ